MRVSRTIIALLFAAGFGGCTGSSPSTPSPANGPTPGSSPTLVGFVVDTAYRAVADAVVTVVNGPQAGTSMTTNAEGRFTYSQAVTGTLTFRAAKDGYITRDAVSQTSAPGGTPWVYIQLEAVALPVSIAGDYTLTLTADSTCGVIPSELRTRSYAATITGQSTPPVRPETALTLLVLGAPFLDNYHSFPIGVAGDYVAFSVYAGEGFGLVEQIAPKTFLAFYGGAAATVGPSASTISAPFDGVIEYCVYKSEMGTWYDCEPSSADLRVQCTSKNHRLTLTRR